MHVYVLVILSEIEGDESCRHISNYYSPLLVFHYS